MQDNIMQAQAQPIIKLAQANMELLTQFSTSPEVSSQASAIASQLFQQTTESAMKLMQSHAFARLMQGMLNNYTEFLTDLGQSGMAMMSQGQSLLTRQVHEVTSQAVDAAGGRTRRTPLAV